MSFADVYSALTPADLADGVHPTATGYSKIADVWLTRRSCPFSDSGARRRRR